MEDASTIPVTIVTGFLGSGKTTFVNHILSADHGLRLVVMVNDFGAINIDAKLIEKQDKSVISLANGCICCNIESDLIEQLDQLVSQATKLDGILIEMSGIADPAKVIGTIKYPKFDGRLRLDNVIGLIDSEQYLEFDEQAKSIIKTQLIDANLVVLNKSDLVSKETLESITETLLYKNSRTYVSSFARVPLDLIFDNTSELQLAHGSAPKFRMSKQKLNHEFVTWHWQSDKTFSLVTLRQFLSELPNEVYRVKGFFVADTPKDTVIVLNKAGHRDDMQKAAWVKPDDFITQLVFIAQAGSVDFEIVKQGLEKCLIN